MPNAYQLQHFDFSDEVDVICPNCQRKALVKGGKPAEEQVTLSIRCICVHCGYNQRYSEREADWVVGNSQGKVRGYPMTLWGGDVDPFFSPQALVFGSLPGRYRLGL